jgi:Zn-finger in Ran binding protein and others
MAIREGRWDCPSCGSTAIYGRHVECPGCGKPRPAGIRFYLTDDAPAITDAAQLAQARAGADWVCEHCGASNRATEPECGGCGASRGSSPSQRVVDYDLAQVPRSGETQRPRGLAGVAPGGGKQFDKAPAEPGKPSCFGCGCLTLMAMLLLSLLSSVVTRCSDAGPVGGEDLRAATVTAKRWERFVVVEERTVVRGEGWELPDSAEVVRRRRRFKEMGQEVDHYRTVTRQVPRTERVSDGTRTRTREVDERVRTGTRTYVCGQRDLGNGYFEDVECSEPVYETRTRTERWEEPVYRDETHYETVTDREPVYREVAVYDTFYTWRAPRWNVVDTLWARGDTTRPVWPDTALGRNRRRAARGEAYWVSFRHLAGGPVGARVPLYVWARWRVGDRVGLRTGTAGDSVSMEVFPADSLAACRRWHAGRIKEPPPDSVGCSPPPPRGQTPPAGRGDVGAAADGALPRIQPSS